jgi:hypothetical protein
MIFMGDCSSLVRCTFFSIKAKDKTQALALAGFMSVYCRGPKQDQCLRRFVGRTLGGPDNIPMNMLPNGLPLSGISDSDWPSDVKILLSKKRSER